MQADETVLSEVHMETCPPAAPGTTWCTRFSFSLPEDTYQHQDSPETATEVAAATQDDTDSPVVDSDGDLVLRSRAHRQHHSITIQHSLATPLSSCGEQVWQGALLLCDWLLANSAHPQEKVVVELGAGVGLVSILAGIFAKTVFLTDVDPGALQLAQQNAAEAAHSVKAGTQVPIPTTNEGAIQAAVDVRVRSLDWLALFDTQLQQLQQTEVLRLLNSTVARPRAAGQVEAVRGASRHDHQQQQMQQPPQDHQHQHQHQHQHHQHQQPEVQPETQGCAQGATPNTQHTAAPLCCWSPADLQALSHTSLWLAADVVYDTTLTDTFMHTAAALMRWQQQQQQQQQEDPDNPRRHHQQQQQQLQQLQHNQHQPVGSAAEASGGITAQPRLIAAQGEQQQQYQQRQGPKHPSQQQQQHSQQQAASNAAGTLECTPTQPRLIVALEKRYNFTLRDMDAVAPAFEHFMSYIQPTEASLAALPQQEQQRLRQQQLQQRALFKGERIDLGCIPQALQYDRNPSCLELWQLTLLQ